jgi:hypothetical protein
VQNLYARNLAVRLNAREVKALTPEDAREAMGDPVLAQAVESTLAVIAVQSAEIKRIEGVVLAAVRPRPEYELLKGAPGIGVILALTILLEAGDIGRFPGPGHFASYCRCVGSEKLSNGEEEGRGEREVREPVPGVGLCRGGPPRHPELQGGARVLREEAGQEELDRRPPGGGAQTGEGLLPHAARQGGVRYEAGVHLRERDGATSQKSGVDPSHPA